MALIRFDGPLHYAVRAIADPNGLVDAGWERDQQPRPRRIIPTMRPPGPSLLVLVRHAESERNLAKKGTTFFSDDEGRPAVVGVPDHEVALTEHGRDQATRTGFALHRQWRRFDCVFHSGYRRTEATTELILSAFADAGPLTPRHHLYLRERDAGWAYDMTTAEAQTAFPWLQDYWATFGSFFARPPGGESLADVVARVDRFMDLLSRECAGRRVLVVTHVGTLRAFRYLLENWTHDEFVAQWTAPVPNCAVTAYERDPETSRLCRRDLNVVFWR